MEIVKETNSNTLTKHPLDDEEFSINSFLNHLLPNETSLESLDLIEANLNEELNSVEKELQQLLREQGEVGQSHSVRLEAIELEMKELLSSIQILSEQAEASELVVFEVTEGIKGLDLAKNNLTQTITFSKRLQMLVGAVEQLKLATENKAYTEAGQLIQAVIELFLNFQNFRSIRPIYELKSTISNLQTQLLKSILTDFKRSFDHSGALTASGEDLIQLKEGCSIIEYAHSEGKKQLLDFYMHLQISEYTKTFPIDDEVGSLENFSRRYAWLKRYLISYDESHASLFPTNWNVDFLVCQKFCEVSSQALTYLLERNDDVGLLVKTLQITLGFELQLDKKFIKVIELEPILMVKFENTLSCCFEPYLHLYIEREERSILKMIEGFKLLEVKKDEDSSIPVLNSSTELMRFYQDSLNTFSKVTNNKPLLNLAELFSKWLNNYLEIILLPLIPKEDKRIFNNNEIETICLILNTSKYCHESATELEARLIELIDKNYSDKINYNQCRDNFIDLSNQSIKQLVKAWEHKFQTGFHLLLKVNWTTWAHLSPNPEYCVHLIDKIKECGQLMSLLIHYPGHFRSFCEKIAESFIIKWADTIVKIKRLPDMAIRQIMEDSEIILDQLLKLPITNQIGKEIPASYQKLIQRIYQTNLSKYLELVKMPLRNENDIDTMAIEPFLNLFMEYAKEPHFPAFLRLMEVKGIKHNEQSLLREALQKRVSLLHPMVKNTNEIKRTSIDLGASYQMNSNQSNSTSTSPFFNSLSLKLSSNNANVNNNNNLNELSSSVQNKLQFGFRRFVGLPIQREFSSPTFSNIEDEKSS